MIYIGTNGRLSDMHTQYFFNNRLSLQPTCICSLLTFLSHRFYWTNPHMSLQVAPGLLQSDSLGWWWRKLLICTSSQWVLYLHGSFAILVDGPLSQLLDPFATVRAIWRTGVTTSNYTSKMSPSSIE